MTTPIKFGTDGWRAIIGEDFTFDNVRAVAQSTAQFLQASGLAGRGLVVGYDTRFASADFAQAVAEVVTANGIRVQLASRYAPTPAVSNAVLHFSAGGGVVITSSHNPFRWNGYKYKPDYAGSASPEVVAALEEPLERIVAGQSWRRMTLEAAEQDGLLSRFDPRPLYMEKVRSLIDLRPLQEAHLRIAVDSMYGAGQGYIDELVDGGAQVTELHAEVNPAFPGIHAPEPIGSNLKDLLWTMKSGDYQVGLATDGDADRLGVVDENGRFINQLETYALLAYYLLEVRGQRGPLVKSVTTTGMINKLGALYGVPVHETPVGFKYLGPKMMETDAIVAGEESGGYGFKGHLPERDGVLAGLYFLDLVARTGRRPSQLLEDLFAKVGPHFYDRIDTPMDPAQRQAVVQRLEDAHPMEIAGQKVTGRDTTDGFRFLFDKGWLLFRLSGTEPLVRIYTEVTDEGLVQPVLEQGKQMAGLS